VNNATALLCPSCRVDLVMSERQNIEIDYCPKCRGVWLDRGELDKIIERSMREEAPIAPAPQAQAYPARSYRDDDYRSRPHGDHDEYRHGRKRKYGSFLSDLFD
jgi:uncharacterized protein